MRDGNPRVRRRRHAGGHAGNDLEGHARRGQRLGLLAAAPEHERVAALQPHHPLARPGQLDEQPVRLLLRQRRARPAPCRRSGARRRAARPRARRAGSGGRRGSRRPRRSARATCASSGPGRRDPRPPGRRCRSRGERYRRRARARPPRAARRRPPQHALRDVRPRAAGSAADPLSSSRIQRDPSGRPAKAVEAQFVAIRCRVGADRGVARGAERLDESALGGEAGERVAVGDARRPPPRPPIGRRGPPARGSPGPAAGTKTPASSGAPSLAAAEPVQAGLREHDCFEIALGQAAKSRVDVAAQVTYIEVRPQGDRAARRRRLGGADHRALGEASSESAPQSASRASARSGTPTIASPSGSSAGTSFAECTARSISPASSASSISFTKRDLS